jgi:hypothetical protein
LLAAGKCDDAAAAYQEAVSKVSGTAAPDDSPGTLTITIVEAAARLVDK